VKRTKTWVMAATALAGWMLALPATAQSRAGGGPVIVSQPLQFVQEATPEPRRGPGSDRWRVIGQSRVSDKAEYDIVRTGDGRRYSQVRVCAERNAIRLRRAEMTLGNGRSQRLFLPLVLAEDQCSRPIDTLGGRRVIRQVRFDNEALTLGRGNATIVVEAR
jgi:hypothetical protein